MPSLLLRQREQRDSRSKRSTSSADTTVGQRLTGLTTVTFFRVSLDHQSARDAVAGLHAQLGAAHD